MNTITGFISRSLDRDSPLKKLTTEFPELEWIDHSMIRFKQVLFTHVPETDWIFFTSSRSVHFFLHCIDENNMELPDRIQWAVMGSGTAEGLRKHRIEPDFIGSGKPSKTARDFLRNASDQSVLFPRASTSRRSIQRALKDQIDSIDLVVYDNSIREDVGFPILSIAILSSPLNARGFVQQYPYELPDHILAWGSSTAEQLRSLKVEGIMKLKEPSEAAAAEEVRTILKKS